MQWINMYKCWFLSGVLANQSFEGQILLMFTVFVE